MCPQVANCAVGETDLGPGGSDAQSEYSLREGTYYGGAGRLCSVASLGVLPGASIVYIEILGPQDTPMWGRGDEGSRQRELRIKVWRGDEWLVGEHERMHMNAAKTILGSESKT